MAIKLLQLYHDNNSNNNKKNINFPTPQMPPMSSGCNVHIQKVSEMSFKGFYNTYKIEGGRIGYRTKTSLQMHYSKKPFNKLLCMEEK